MSILSRPVFHERRVLTWTNEVLDLPQKDINILKQELQLSKDLEDDLQLARRRRKSCLYSDNYRRKQKKGGGKVRASKRSTSPLPESAATAAMHAVAQKTQERCGVNIIEHAPAIRTGLSAEATPVPTTVDIEAAMMKSELARLRLREQQLEQRVAELETTLHRTMM